MKAQYFVAALALLPTIVAAQSAPPKRKPVSTVTNTPPMQATDQIPSENLSLLAVPLTPEGTVAFIDEKSIQPSIREARQIEFRMLTAAKKPAAGQPIGAWAHMLASCRQDSWLRFLKATPVLNSGSIRNGQTTEVPGAQQQNIVAGTIPAAIHRLACEDVPQLQKGPRLTSLSGLKAFINSPDVAKLGAKPASATYPKAPTGKARLYNPQLNQRTAYDRNNGIAGPTPPSVWFDMGSIERVGDLALLWKLIAYQPGTYKNEIGLWHRVVYDCKKHEGKFLGVVNLLTDLSPKAYKPFDSRLTSRRDMESRDQTYFPQTAVCLPPEKAADYAQKIYPLVDIGETIKREHQRILTGRKPAG